MRRLGGVCTLASALTLAAPAWAQPAPDDAPGWKYRRFDALDATVTLTGVAAVVAATFVWPASGESRWEGGILFDDGVRDALRARSRSGRDNARLVGDVFYICGGLYPIVVDGAFAFLVRQDSDLAAQMLLIDAEAFAISGALLIGSERLFARARPSAEPCEQDPDYEEFCGEPDRAASMISGHTGIVSTSAGLLCAHHQYLELYGSPVADAAACAFGIGAAVTTGVARTINDRHYATDVLAAFVVGGSIGYALPVLRFYAPGPLQRDPAHAFAVLPSVGRTSAGASVVGLF